ncbi:hypothetical protein IVG45_15115 [Methylomonas sp. LL1]|uniref:hypothetical protein n=1 Tax=Methylomonas sp. LL1 TaxID=2785785 RepID=UPI0018C408BE|nr:hypothetical protein [Methylomonas sp. LL1]QPK62183.1 hypothetical protein IVG45_15115 [Methylomonas sp. LL1]
MITKPHAQKYSHHRYAWFALAAFPYAATASGLNTDTPVAAVEASVPAIVSLPELVKPNPIPADNPIGAILLGKQHPLLLRADFSRVSELVSQIYQSTAFQPIWFTANRSEKN